MDLTSPEQNFQDLIMFIIKYWINFAEHEDRQVWIYVPVLIKFWWSWARRLFWRLVFMITQSTQEAKLLDYIIPAIMILFNPPNEITWYIPYTIYVQSSAVITRSNITRYCIHHRRKWGRISIRGWIHKRRPIPRPNGRAVGCLLWIFLIKLIAL